ncbi:MAG: hypothetical protein KAX19_12045 [Candidatus Brocadiae bacterium]|nr:hypothetical protein [Candidatus Brocadiia bacterium]
MPIPAATLWRDDEFGTAVLSEYSERVRLDFDENPFLKVLKVAAGIVHGSNPFAACLVDMIVRPRARVATPVDLQAILDSRNKTSTPVRMRGGYKDAALALRSVKEPNSYLAERLAEQLDPKMEWPVVIHLSGLELIKDPESPCGLSFQFTPGTRAFHAPILLAGSGHFDNALVDRETGLPTRIEGAGRYFYSTEEGLARMYLGRGSSIDTIWNELGHSQVDGRVVLVDNSVPSEEVAEYIARLDAATELLES